jgi:rare lipoprotein A
MKLPVTFGLAVAALALSSGASATHSFAAEFAQLSPPPAEAPDVTAPIQIAPGAQAVAQLASAAGIVMPPPAETEAPAPIPPVASAALPMPSLPIKADKHHLANNQTLNLAGNIARPDRYRVANASDGEAKIINVKAIGPCLIGSAAWYGGRYIGRRTSSGEPLDQIHATAAHRTLPLNSLVRVTNLSNGRSVVVRITDRGPVSERLLIDMSPRAADELAMKTAGIVPVSVEQVVEVADASK